MTPYRVGVIGYGGIGRALCEFLRDDPRFALAFVHNRPGKPPPQDLDAPWCTDLATAQNHTPDLIVEAAHPRYTVERGAVFLRFTDYMPVSTSALVDDALRVELEAVARAHGTRLLLPHGALVGLPSLLDEPSSWAEVEITFTKHPGSLDGASITTTTEPTVLFDGPVRDVALRYPRNVNSMITLALATTGLDACRGRLVLDPGATSGRLEIRAQGHDGSVLQISRCQPMVGVSGTEMAASIRGSVVAAAGATGPGVHFI